MSTSGRVVGRDIKLLYLSVVDNFLHYHCKEGAARQSRCLSTSGGGGGSLSTAEMQPFVTARLE